MFLAAVIAIIGKASWPFGAPIITAVLEHTFRRILFQQPREEDEERKEKKEAFHKKRNTDLTRSQWRSAVPHLVLHGLKQCSTHRVATTVTLFLKSVEWHQGAEATGAYIATFYGRIALVTLQQTTHITKKDFYNRLDPLRPSAATPLRVFWPVSTSVTDSQTVTS